MPRNIGPELKAELERRYRAREISKNEYLFEKARLEERIARGEAIERSTGEKIFKWSVIGFMVVMSVALMVVFRDWFFYLVGGTELILAFLMARRP